MPVPEWLFGPAGDLRPLPAPSQGMTMTRERFGGTHVAITGGRTVDTFGHKVSYDFELPALTPDEAGWVEALAIHPLTPDLYLLDPVRRNLVTRKQSLGAHVDVVNASRSRITYNSTNRSPSSWATGGISCSSLSNSQDAVIRTTGDLVPVPPGSPVTLSTYVRAVEEPLDISLSVTFFDSLGNEISSSSDDDQEISAGIWSRPFKTFEVPMSASFIRPRIVVRSEGKSFGASVALNVSSLQLEVGAAMTDSAPGGAAIRCFIDSYSTTSPVYPIQYINMTITEV